MGKVTGFKEWSRELPAEREASERIRDFREFYLEQPPERLRHQGGRCMDCGVPFCQQGCPLGNQIPDWNDLVYRDKFHQAYLRLASTNNFPEFTGRLCPAPCESACVLAINTDPVTIEHIEKEIIERAFAEGWVKPEPPRTRSGRRVAVVGSGPAGLAAAAQLNSAGHTVVVYEADDRIGGLLRYGIPDFKLEKQFIDRRLEIMVAEGVEFKTGVRVGADPTWVDLHETCDAILVAVGSQRPRDLPIAGRELDGVHFAMDYLTQQNRRVNRSTSAGPRISAQGKHVIILGGGDTGSDCLGTALRQKPASVRQIELFPKPPKERPTANPWPQWPLVFHTSSSQEEGGARDFAILTKEFVGTAGVLRGLRAVRVTLQPDGKLSECPSSDFEIPADMVLLAMGFTGPKTDDLHEQLGVALDARGNVAADPSYATNVRRVFTAGDAHRGQSLIVWAIAEGREAARAIDATFQTHGPSLPTRGRDELFGGR